MYNSQSNVVLFLALLMLPQQLAVQDCQPILMWQLPYIGVVHFHVAAGTIRQTLLVSVNRQTLRYSNECFSYVLFKFLPTQVFFKQRVITYIMSDKNGKIPYVIFGNIQDSLRLLIYQRTYFINRPPTQFPQTGRRLMTDQLRNVSERFSLSRQLCI